MRLLTCFLFAGLVTIQINDVGARSPKNKEPEESSSRFDNDALKTGKFNPKAIARELGTYSTNVSFFEVFVKMLTGVRRGSLGLVDAVNFIRGISKFAAGLSFCAYLTVFGDILNIVGNFGRLGNYDQESLRQQIAVAFDLVLKVTIGKEEHDMSNVLALWVARLIIASNDQVERRAEDVVSAFLRDTQVYNAIRRSFPQATVPAIGSAYSFVKDALAEQQ